MTIEEILKHKKVHNLDVRYTPEYEFTIYPFIYTADGNVGNFRPVEGHTLQIALDKVVARFKLGE